MNLPYCRAKTNKGTQLVHTAYSRLTRAPFCDTYETRRVIVTDGLGVTEGLKYGVSLDDLIFQRALLLGVLVLLARSANGGEVRNDLLGVLSLSGTRFTGNQHRLVLVVRQHVDVGTVRDGEQMRRHFITALATVHLGATVGIQRVTLVRVDDNAEQARVGLWRRESTWGGKKMITLVKTQINDVAWDQSLIHIRKHNDTGGTFRLQVDLVLL